MIIKKKNNLISLSKFKYKFVNKFIKSNKFTYNLKNKLKKIIKIFIYFYKNKLKKFNIKFYNINKYNYTLYCESFKYYLPQAQTLYIKNLILNSLHQYTGYTNIILNFKPIYKSIYKKIENKYYKLNEYMLSNLNIVKKYKDNKNLIEKFKIEKLKEWNTFLIGLKSFLKFYEQKDFLNLIHKLYYYISLPILDPLIKFNFVSSLLFDMFKYIYIKKNNFFKKAFFVFNKLMYNLFFKNYLPFSGIKIIVKGRFGKNRKQIARIQLGFLKLHTLVQLVNYSNNILYTSRGSYGFHIWCSYLNRNLFPQTSMQNVEYNA